MREVGFEPTKALSHKHFVKLLKLARLTRLRDSRSIHHPSIIHQFQYSKYGFLYLSAFNPSQSFQQYFILYYQPCFNFQTAFCTMVHINSPAICIRCDRDGFLNFNYFQISIKKKKVEIPLHKGHPDIISVYQRSVYVIHVVKHQTGYREDASAVLDS